MPFTSTVDQRIGFQGVFDEWKCSRPRAIFHLLLSPLQRHIVQANYLLRYAYIPKITQQQYPSFGNVWIKEKRLEDTTTAVWDRGSFARSAGRTICLCCLLSVRFWMTVNNRWAFTWPPSGHLHKPFHCVIGTGYLEERTSKEAENISLRSHLPIETSRASS